MSYRNLFHLVKGNISILATLSAVAGFILSGKEFSLSHSLWGVFFGTLLLAMGASALNQYQERDIDSKMVRTRDRPIPSGTISPGRALSIAILLAISGIFVLHTTGGILTAALGALALTWYNGVYTFLKRVSAFAVVPGALVGSIPPAIGWVAGGGSITDPEIAIFSFFFFIWQVPHFWLLTIKYGEDYRRAGLPSPADTFNKKQLSRITFIWLMATGVTALSIPFFKIMASPPIGLLLAGGTFLFILRSLLIFEKSEGELPVPALFRDTNLYALLVIVLVSLDGLI